MASNMSQLLDLSYRFEHAPLDKEAKEIRLVRIKPALEAEEPLQLELKVVSLGSGSHTSQHRAIGEAPGESLSTRSGVTNDEPGEIAAFTALSYVWGAETPSHDVCLEHGQHYGWMTVRQNLYDFLQTIRDCSDCSLWFWIDQLCINQVDDREKGHQVDQMSEVYTKAARVEVWLGPAFEGSDWVYDFFLYLWCEFDSLAYLDGLISENRPALLKFLTLPYWSRLWVVQEITLNEKTELRFGTYHGKTIPRDDVFRALGHMAELRVIKELTQLPISTFLTRRNDAALDWSSVWTFAAERECTQSYDKVFGLMALLPESSRFRPEYSMDVTDILLTILDRLLCNQLDAGSKDGNSYGLEHVALGWYQVLDAQHTKIDRDIVRNFLLHKAHPALRKLPQTTVPYYPFRKHLYEVSCALENRLRHIALRAAVPWIIVSPLHSLARKCRHVFNPSRATSTGHSAATYRLLRFVDPFYVGVGARPTCLLRVQLWWMFPDRGSGRWRSSWLRCKDPGERLVLRKPESRPSGFGRL